MDVEYEMYVGVLLEYTGTIGTPVPVGETTVLLAGT